MRARAATSTAVGLAALGLAAALIFGGTSPSSRAKAKMTEIPSEPTVDIVSPRNGARQSSHAVVVKVKVDNFKLAPMRFDGEPQLGEGHLRFSLNKVPDCVDPVKLLHAINSPLGNQRLVGASFDYAKNAGPNGVLAERIGTSGSYSPATKAEIFYHELPPGLYRLVVSLAQNNGSTTRYHDVTNFQILLRPGQKPRPCPKGKVPSAAAADNFR